MPSPAVRARHLKSTLAAAEALPAAGAAVRRFVAPEVLGRIERAHGQDWLPVEDDVRLVRVVHGVLGPAAYDGFARDVVLGALDGPLLGPMLRIALAAVGRDPAAWVRWIPKAWTLVYRDAGRWTVAPDGPAAARLEVVGLPGCCLDEEMWPTSLASSLSAVLAGTGVEGRSVLVEVDRARALARYALGWTPRG